MTLAKTLLPRVLAASLISNVSLYEQHSGQSLRAFGGAGMRDVVAPAAIPRTVGIRIGPSAYLLCYLLAAAELALAVLSWGARSISDKRSIRLIIVSFMVLHGATGLLEG